MATIYLTDSELDELEDHDLDELALLVTVQDQLNASRSVAALSHRMDRDDRHWTERLSDALDGMPLPVDDPGRGWAGRNAR